MDIIESTIDSQFNTSNIFVSMDPNHKPLDYSSVSQPSIQFSYKAQVDDGMEEDTVSLPHQQSFSSLKTDSDYIYQVHTPSIHMPLYESLTAKPPPNQRTSLYSLTSRKDSKFPGTSRYSSHAALYALSPEARKSHFRDSQTSVTDVDHRNLLSPSTASNFLYTPKDNDSSANLFSEPKMGNEDNLSLSRAPVDPARQISVKLTGRTKLVTKSPSTSVLPPLESSLQNILDSENGGRGGGKLPRSLSFGRSVKSLDLDLGRERGDSGGSSEQEGEGVGGLGDYLQSLQSPVYPRSMTPGDTGDTGHSSLG